MIDKIKLKTNIMHIFIYLPYNKVSSDLSLVSINEEEQKALFSFVKIIYNKRKVIKMIYLISCTSNYLLKEELTKIIGKKTNIITMDYNNETIKDCLEEAAYTSLFTEEKVLIIKNANLFTTAKTKDSDIEEISKYLEQPNELTTVIFTTNNKIDMRKNIVKKIKEKYHLIILDNLKPKDLINKVSKLFCTDAYNIDYKTLCYITNSCQNNYDLIYHEVEKIKLYYLEQKNIKYEDVVNIVSKTNEDNNFRLIEAIMSRNIPKSFEIYQDLKFLRIEPISILMLIVREFRLTYMTKVLLKNTSKISTISSSLKLQDWQTEKIAKQVYNWSIKELKEKLLELANTDIAIKRGKIDGYNAIEQFILNI